MYKRHAHISTVMPWQDHTDNSTSGTAGYLRFGSVAQCAVHSLKGLALLRACHSSEIALAGSRRLHSMLAAAPVLYAHVVVTEIKNK